MRLRLLPLAAILALAGCSGMPAAPTGPTSVPASHTPASHAPASRASATQAAASTSPGPHHGATCRPRVGLSAGEFIGGLGPDALTGVQFISPAQGWVVGRHVILATDNGGVTWTVERRGELNLTSVDFVNAETGWAVGLDSLLATSNGGRTWISLPEPCGIIRAVHFVSARVGYAVAGGVGPVFDAAVAPNSDGAVMVTNDGGVTWRPVRAPADAQTVCFFNHTDGWLGADGNLYESGDGGRSWQLRARGEGRPGLPGTMFVQCASGSAWATDIGPGVASNQQPHVGFYAGPGVPAKPLFAEQYFPYPAFRKVPTSAGAYAGPMSAISAGTAAFIDTCAPCGIDGTVPWLLATAGGQLSRQGNVTGISWPWSASFMTPSLGWMVGYVRTGGTERARIVHTADGGRSWQVQYEAR